LVGAAQFCNKRPKRGIAECGAAERPDQVTSVDEDSDADRYVSGNEETRRRFGGAGVGVVSIAFSRVFVERPACPALSSLKRKVHSVKLYAALNGANFEAV